MAEKTSQITKSLSIKPHQGKGSAREIESFLEKETKLANKPKINLQIDITDFENTLKLLRAKSLQQDPSTHLELTAKDEAHFERLTTPANFPLFLDWLKASKISSLKFKKLPIKAKFLKTLFTGIRQVPNLHSLNLSSIMLGLLGKKLPEILQALIPSSLQSLNLSNTQLGFVMEQEEALEEENSETANGYPENPKLKFLEDLAKIFSTFEELDLSHNNLTGETNLDEDSDLSLSSFGLILGQGPLRSINFSYCKLGQLKDNEFPKFIRGLICKGTLRTLNLAGNKLYFRDPKTFQELGEVLRNSAVSDFNISDNGLTSNEMQPLLIGLDNREFMQFRCFEDSTSLMKDGFSIISETSNANIFGDPKTLQELVKYNPENRRQIRDSIVVCTGLKSKPPKNPETSQKTQQNVQDPKTSQKSPNIPTRNPKTAQASQQPTAHDAQSNEFNGLFFVKLYKETDKFTSGFGSACIQGIFEFMGCPAPHSKK